LPADCYINNLSAIFRYDGLSAIDSVTKILSGQDARAH
jgi:hypothetical protein